MRLSTALSHRLVVFGLPVTTSARFLATAVHGVHSGPRAPLGFLLRHPALLVPFLYVLSLPLLFLGVLRFVSAWHFFLLIDCEVVVQIVYRRSEIGQVGWHLSPPRGIFSA
jgi:hypothetical protein